MNSHKLRAAVFDLDGTAADTMNDLGDSMNEMLRQFGFPERTYEQLLSAINHGAEYFVRHSLPGDEKIQSDSALVSRCIEVYDGIYGRYLTRRTVLYPGIKECTKTLKDAGLKLALLSNKQHPRACALAEHLFGDSMPFDIVLGQEKYPPKPDRSAPSAILGSFGVKPCEAAMIGDSDIDIITAKNTGTRSIGVTWGYRSEKLLEETGADFIVHTPRELADLILELAR